MITFIYPPVPIDSTGLATGSGQAAQTVLLQEIADNTDQIEAKQDAQTTELNNIKGDTASISSSSSSLLAKTEAALVIAPHDYREITYVGATTKINTVVYKLGGAAGTTVATLTMAYDGSDRLTSVTKS